MDETGADRRRRRWERVPVRLEAGYEDPDRQVFLCTRDLSEGGVFLLAQDPPPEGTAARLLLELPRHPAILRLPGVVARREPGAGFALAFDRDRMAPEARAALREFSLGSERTASQ